MERNFAVENKMYHLALELIEKRYPKGWGGAAVIRTEKDHYYTSVSLEGPNGGTTLCIEVRAMCDATKYDEKVTHCMCVVKDDENSAFKVLSPCGICQERLRYWGENVQVAVTTQDSRLQFVELKTLQPYHWTNAYIGEDLDSYDLDHKKNVE